MRKSDYEICMLCDNWISGVNIASVMEIDYIWKERNRQVGYCKAMNYEQTYEDEWCDDFIFWRI